MQSRGFLILIGWLMLLQQVQAQSAQLRYISPVPGSRYVMPGNNVALRHGDPFDEKSIRNDLLSVTTRESGRMAGDLLLSTDGRTLIFTPRQSFELGAQVFVKLHKGLYTINGSPIEPVEFDFFVTDSVVDVNGYFIEKHLKEKDLGLRKLGSMPQVRQVVSDTTFPEGYPATSVLVDNNPPEGYYFYTASDDWNWFPENEPFLVIADEYATPVYYKKLASSGYDLKIQHNGLLSFYTYIPYYAHQVMDSAFQLIKVCGMGNGYGYTDFHDFQYFDNGHYFVMTYDPQIVDMSQVVPGGHPEAQVIGFVLQELDSCDNVVFQWRSWDHFEITETGPEIDLTAETIDYVHGNTLEVESDTSILISSRNMHEITKIHRNSGEIIWRLGGSQNQFEFIGDSLMFNRQHDCRRLADGNISIFDNGTTRPEPQFSSVPVLDVSPSDSTATLISRYRHEPDYLGLAMGNAQWTPDSTVVIGWGSGIPGITEIDYEGNTLFELQFDAMSYRAYRFPWKTTYFDTDVDLIEFDTVGIQTTNKKYVVVTNNQPDTISITGYHLLDTVFTVNKEFPFSIAPNEQDSVPVFFYTYLSGEFTDKLTLNSDINSDTLVQRIAQQVRLSGYAQENQEVKDFQMLRFESSPNPVRDELCIRLKSVQKEVLVRIFDTQGQLMLEKTRYNTDTVELTLGEMAPGLYIVQVLDGTTQASGHQKVIKR